MYVAANPAFITSLRVRSYFYAVSDMDVLIRLHSFGLLPEGKRIEVATSMKELAVSTPDAGFLKPEVRTLLTPDELAEIVEAIRIELLPALDETIDQWRYNHDGTTEPEEHFAELKEALSDFKTEFSDDQESVNRIDIAFQGIERAIEKLREGTPPEPDHTDYFQGRSTTPDDGSRSIFDDVDEW